MVGVICQSFKCLIVSNFRTLSQCRPILWKVKLCSSSSVTTKKTEGLEPQYTKRDHEYRISKSATIKTLQNLLGIKTFDAFRITSDNKSLFKTSSAVMCKNHSIYLQKSITNETIMKYPELLAVSDLSEKLEEIQKLSEDINSVIILVTIPLDQLEKFVQSELEASPERSKIKMLSKLLQVDVDKACEFIADKPFLRSLSVDKIESNVKLLTSYGISLDEICNDLWVLRYSHQLIENRFNIAKQHKIDVMKTWMVRAQPEIFQNYIQRRSDNKSILGNSSLAEYLSQRLECSVDAANYMILKNPALKNKSLKKLKELIDLLYSEGFKPHHICRISKILVHGVKTTKKRLKKLEENDIQIDSLHMLTKSQKQFNQYYEALIKTKKKLKNLP